MNLIGPFLIGGNFIIHYTDVIILTSDPILLQIKPNFNRIMLTQQAFTVLLGMRFVMREHVRQ